MMIGCSRNSETQKLWHKADEYVVIEERYLTKEQSDLLKAHLSNDCTCDGIGRFYVKQSIVERSIKAPLIIIVTPFTVIIDGVSMVVNGLADIEHTSGGPGTSGFDGRLIASLIEAIIRR